MEMWNLYPSYTSMSHEYVNALKHQQVAVNIHGIHQQIAFLKLPVSEFLDRFLFPMDHVGPVFDTMSFLCG